MNKKRLNFYVLIIACWHFFQPAMAADTKRLIQQSLVGDHRSEIHKARDVYRHPAETLDFFGLKSDMTVVEIWPGGAGWYTEILAPVLFQKGNLYTAHFNPNSEVAYFKKSYRKFAEKTKANSDLYGNIRVTILQPPSLVTIAPPESADLVLTFRNVHNWMRNDQALTVFKAMFDALKPSGILGVVEHRAPTTRAQDPKAKSGYVREDYVVDLARQAGFIFIAKSEINANPKDLKDHPKGVWTLPPSLRLKEQDQDKYLTIGESDRMTLKFKKPN